MPHAAAMIEALHDSVDRVEVLLRRAGDAIMDVYANEFDVTLKADKSPVTLADTRSSDIVTDGLVALFPEWPVLGEETATLEYGERRHWEYYWLLDPLDGTREFIKRNNEFCINLALMHRERPVAGFIHQPVSNTLFLTTSTGVTRVDATGLRTAFSPADAQPASENAKSLVVVTSRSHSLPSEQTTLDAVAAAGYKVRFASVGSAIKFCLMIEGKVQLYLRYGPTSEWDTAAGHALLNAVGGSVVRTADRQPLAYNKERLLNPPFAAFAPSVHQLVNYLS